MSWQPKPQPPLPSALHRSELLAAGFTDEEIRTSYGSGTWQRLHRGVYCEAQPLLKMLPAERYRLRAQAVADRSPNLVLSHVSAAALLGLPMWDLSLDRVHLSRRGMSGGRAGPGRVVHSAQFADGEVTRLDGRLITSVARTLVDLGCSSPLESTVIAADYALNGGLDPDDVAAALALAPHRRGVGAARRSLALADGRSESAGETRTRITMHRLGLPKPELQICVYAPDGTFLGRTDLGYPELGVLIEFDGRMKYLKHLNPGQHAEDVVVAEKEREDRIRGLGYIVTRFVWSDLRDPASMEARIRRDIERARPIVAAGSVIGRWEAKPPRTIVVSR